MKRITLEEIETKHPAGSYEQLCRYIYGQIENKSIKPVKACGTNGKKPALYLEYWVMEEKADYSCYIEELQYHMSTKISVDYYLRHLDQYAEDRKWVQKLNAYFLQAKKEDNVLISKNERSFQIFGREKFLQTEQGRKILKRCGIDVSQASEASRLSFYETAEPLAFYSLHRRTPQNLLILENKDTFYSMRRYLMEDGGTIFGLAAATLIYGAGKGIQRSFGDFSFCAEPYMRAPGNQIYYFGDLDYEGIGIYERLAASFAQQQYLIVPFRKAYECMLAKAQTVLELPVTKEKQNRNLSGHFFSFFSEETVCGMKKILENERYIPQEILNITDFREDAQTAGKAAVYEKTEA